MSYWKLRIKHWFNPPHSPCEVHPRVPGNCHGALHCLDLAMEEMELGYPDAEMRAAWEELDSEFPAAKLAPLHA